MAPESLSMRKIIAEDLTYPARDGVAIDAYLARPDLSGRHPAVLVLHARNGLQPFFKECSEELAQEGFVGFSVGWQTRLPPNEEGKLPSHSAVLEDIASALVYLRAQPFVAPERIGIMGFCRGGTLVFLAVSMLQGLTSGVAHYGAPKLRSEGAPQEPEEDRIAQPYDLADHMNLPLLIIQGDQDRAVPLEDVLSYRDKLKRLGKAVSLHVYSGVGHAFTIRGGRSYNDEAARDAWQKTVSHFKATLC